MEFLGYRVHARVDCFRDADRGFENLLSRNLSTADKLGDSKPVILSVL
jgi:hypothetical protein